MSFKTGTFPDILNIGKVKLLFTKNDHMDMGNYRPVSILSCVSKIFENIMKERLQISYKIITSYININLVFIKDTQLN